MRLLKSQGLSAEATSDGIRIFDTGEVTLLLTSLVGFPESAREGSSGGVHAKVEANWFLSSDSSVCR